MIVFHRNDQKFYGREVKDFANFIDCISTRLGTIAAAATYKKGNVTGINTGFQQGLKDGLKNIKNIDVDAFKKVGNFKKGKAFINGKEFSGAIYTPNGHKLIYNNGVLSDSVGPISTKYYHNGKLASARFKEPYELMRNIDVARYNHGTIKYHTSYEDKFANILEPKIITTIKPDGSITRQYTNLEKKASCTGSVYTYDKIVDLKTKKCTGIKIKDVKKASTSNTIKHKEHSFVDGKKVTKEYENGELVKTYITEYNPKTGIVVETHIPQGKRWTECVVKNPKDNTKLSFYPGFADNNIYLNQNCLLRSFKSLDELKLNQSDIKIDPRLLDEFMDKVALLIKKTV